MVILSYNHAFTFKQLQVVITQYLQLGPYYQCLIKVTKSYMDKYLTRTLQQRHNEQRQHPIKLPINFYKYSSRISEVIDKDTYTGQYEYIYPLDVIIEIMNSKQFYDSLPKNIIINSLLTTTNISIIIETLKVLSKVLSKLIKSTLDSIEDKKVTKYISNLIGECYDENGNEDQIQQGNIDLIKKNSNELQIIGKILEKGLGHNFEDNYSSSRNLITQSEIKSIRIDSDFQLSKKAITPINTKSRKITRKLSKKQSIILTLLKKENLTKQDPKNVVKNLKTKLIEDKMLRPLWLIDQENDNQQQLSSDTNRFQKHLEHLQKEIARKPKQFKECDYCRNYRSYLIQSTGLSYFDLQQISRVPNDLYKVLKRIKNVVNVFTLYLKENNRTTIPANINIVNKILANIELVITEAVWQNDSLNPSIKKKSYDSNKQKKKGNKLINQMEPYFDQVYNYRSHDTKQFTIDQLICMCLKASELKDVQKTLVQQYMNEARLKKEGKDIETFCITKQNLNQHINHYESSQNNAGLTSSASSPNFKPVLDEIQLMREFEKQQAIINKAVLNSKPVHAQINKRYQQQVSMGAEIKRLKMFSHSKMQKKELEKSQTLKQLNRKNEAKQNEKFKLIMYQQFMRNQGFNITKNNAAAIFNQNAPNNKGLKTMNSIGKQLDNSVDFDLKDSVNQFPQYLNTSKLVRNSANTFSSSQLKCDEEASNSYEKKETQIYNKMLLNGQVIRNEIMAEVEYNDAVIYESMEDFLRRLEELNREVQREEQAKENQDQDLFVTLYGSNVRKSTSAMKKTSKHKQSIRNSIRNSKRYDIPANATKTPKSNFANKFSSISISKGVRFSSKDKLIFKQDSMQNQQLFLKKSTSQKRQFPKQVSIQQIHHQPWNQNIEIKKPDWLAQFIAQPASQKNEKITLSKSHDLLDNQRFKNFQQKCLLRQCLSAEKLNLQKKDSQKRQNPSSIFSQKRQINTKTMTNLKRPVSAFCGSPKNSLNTVKSVGRTLNGKKRSVIISKQFQRQNKSLLSRIYKQNFQSSPLDNAKKDLNEERVFDNFKNKIQKGKFTVDKFLS